MALRKIIIDGDPVLRKTARPIDHIDDHIHTLLDDMAETMYAADGVGLAAPQVGVRRQVVVIDVGSGLIELINPTIIEENGEQCHAEGCLSVPNKQAYVNRPATVKVQAYNRAGEAIEYSAEGYLAIAMCHEIDHLNGILFTDKMIVMTDEEFEERQRQEYMKSYEELDLIPEPEDETLEP